MANPDIERFNWCGHKWETCMENGRPIHPDNPWYYIDGSKVSIINDDLYLRIGREAKTITWWNKEWTEKIAYKSTIACGLVKSVETFPVNSSFECDVMMPKGNNLWFSFWLTACDNWPPEIDIFEGYTDNKGSCLDKLGLHWQFPFIYRNVRFESNVHYKDASGVHRQIGAEGIPQRYLEPLHHRWNHFKCEWRNDSIKFYVNDHLVRTVRNKKVLSKMETKGMWVIFNIWPNDKFDLSRKGDIKSFSFPFIIKDFKVHKI